ncbi:MAG: hypothetical protein ACRCV9_03785, partial [Burkholderiaceae bacterium]
MSKQQRQQSDQLAQEIRALLEQLRAEALSPSPTGFAVVSDILTKLAAIPTHIVTAERVECLLSAAQFQYVSGVANAGLAPCLDSIKFARLLGDKATLRKALSVSGVLNGDCGNVPHAIECLAEALELASDLRDRVAEVAVWTNLGLILLYAAQYSESIECSERAIAITNLAEGMEQKRAIALGNVALASLHLEDINKGLKTARRAADGLSEPSSGNQVLNRVLIESVYARLLLEVDNFAKAKERCELAKKYAKESGLERAELAATVAEGLYEVHAGLKDVGLSRLEKALDRARSMKGFLRDTLVAMVKGYEAAGEPEKALSYLRELMLHTRQAQQENVLYHHRLHLERLEDE